MSVPSLRALSKQQAIGTGDKSSSTWIDEREVDQKKENQIQNRVYFLLGAEQESEGRKILGQRGSTSPLPSL